MHQRNNSSLAIYSLVLAAGLTSSLSAQTSSKTSGGSASSGASSAATANTKPSGSSMSSSKTSATMTDATSTSGAAATSTTAPDIGSRTFGAKATNPNAVRLPGTPTAPPNVQPTQVRDALNPAQDLEEPGTIRQPMPTAAREALAAQQRIAATAPTSAGRLVTANEIATFADRTGMALSSVQVMTTGQLVGTVEQSLDFVRVRAIDGTEQWVPASAVSGVARNSSALLEPGGKVVLGGSLVTLVDAQAGAMGRDIFTAGDTITVVERQGDWLLVRGPAGQAGWVMEDDIVGLSDAIEQRMRTGGSNVLGVTPDA